MNQIRGFEFIDSFKNRDLHLPERKTAGSAGYDFFCVQDATLAKNSITVLQTGVKAFFPEDEFLMLAIRSSLSLKGLMLANGVSIIDADYYGDGDSGHIMLPIFNFSAEDYLVKTGDRIAQGIFVKYQTLAGETFEIKRAGGFGFTGV